MSEAGLGAGAGEILRMVEVSEERVEAARAALEEGRRFHFVGIGGVGMSALARYLLHRGISVSGSDKADGKRLEELRRVGAVVRVGHDAGAVPTDACVVYTTAVPADNPELQEARARGLVVVHRAELLAAVVNAARGIAVTGTHGKTTTTAMLAHILRQAGVEPTAFVGGEVHGWPDGNVLAGRPDIAVYEACESDGTLLLYRPWGAVVTSLEPDHLDQHGSFEGLKETMRRFAARVDGEGFVVACCDSEAVEEVVQAAEAEVISYGESPRATWRAEDVRVVGLERIGFLLRWPGGRTAVTVRAAGRHNALNATAAMAAAYLTAGIEPRQAAQALENYPGVGRRFELVGHVRGCPILHDYAHHPTEVAATIRAAREHLERKVLAVFQPHLYSRTQYLMDGFARCFDEADAVIILPIYGAREEPVEGVEARVLARAIASRGSVPEVKFAEDFDEARRAVLEHCGEGWAVLVLGAGDVEKLAVEIVASEGSGDDGASQSNGRSRGAQADVDA